MYILRSRKAQILKLQINEIADEAFKDGDPLLHLLALYIKIPISAYGDINHGFAPMDRDSKDCLCAKPVKISIDAFFALCRGCLTKL